MPTSCRGGSGRIIVRRPWLPEKLQRSQVAATGGARACPGRESTPPLWPLRALFCQVPQDPDLPGCRSRAWRVRGRAAGVQQHAQRAERAGGRGGGGGAGVEPAEALGLHPAQRRDVVVARGGRQVGFDMRQCIVFQDRNESWQPLLGVPQRHKQVGVGHTEVLAARSPHDVRLAGSPGAPVPAEAGYGDVHQAEGQRRKHQLQRCRTSCDAVGRRWRAVRLWRAFMWLAWLPQNHIHWTDL
jgi:hypothetical protein